jgi:hypothetical protein
MSDASEPVTPDATPEGGRDATNVSDANDEKRAPLDPSQSFVRMLVPFAIAAVVATLLGRVIGPALPGVFAGYSRVVDYVKLAGDDVSQLFGALSVAVAISLGVAALGSRLPGWLRALAAVVTVIVVLVDLSAAIVRVSLFASAMAGLGASSLALACAWNARRSFVARLPALVLAFTAVAGLVRLLAVALPLASPQSASLPRVASWLGAAAIICVLIAQSIALAPSSPRPAQREGQGTPMRLVRPSIAVLLIAAYVIADRAEAGRGDEATALPLLAARAIDRLRFLPAPRLPHALVSFALALGPLSAIAKLVERRAVPAVGATLALALLVGASCELPLHALSLTIASLGLALTVGDGRALWGSIATSARHAEPNVPHDA